MAKLREFPCKHRESRELSADTGSPTTAHTTTHFSCAGGDRRARRNRRTSRRYSEQQVVRGGTVLACSTRESLVHHPLKRRAAVGQSVSLHRAPVRFRERALPLPGDALQLGQVRWARTSVLVVAGGGRQATTAIAGGDRVSWDRSSRTCAIARPRRRSLLRQGRHRSQKPTAASRPRGRIGSRPRRGRARLHL